MILIQCCSCLQPSGIRLLEGGIASNYKCVMAWWVVTVWGMGVGLAREEIRADDIRKVKFLFMIIWRDIRECDYALFGPPPLACSKIKFWFFFVLALWVPRRTFIIHGTLPLTKCREKKVLQIFKMVLLRTFFTERFFEEPKWSLQKTLFGTFCSERSLQSQDAVTVVFLCHLSFSDKSLILKCSLLR